MERTIFLHANLVIPRTGGRADQALIVGEDGRIAAVGPSAKLASEEEIQGAKVVDLWGQTIVPGFIDAHVHVLQTGLAANTIDFDRCRSIAEVLDLVGTAVQPAWDGSEWILGRRLDDFKLAEKRPPTGAELTRVGGKRPVYIDHRSLHYAVVNPPGARLLGLEGTEAESLGIVRGADLHRARQRFYASLDTETKKQAIRKAAEMAVSKGITTLHAIEGGELFGDQDIPLLLSLRTQLPARLVLYWSTADVAKAQGAGLRSVGGDVLLDGTLGSRTAALSAPYTDDPDTCGTLHRDPDEVAAFFRSAEQAGLQAAVHAIGDRAIEQVLDAIEHAVGTTPTRDHRHRIEHFGVPTPRQITRAAGLGVVISTQPAFMLLRGGPGSVYEARLGSEREARAYPLRELLDAGLLVAGGSDSEVTPLDALLGIHACVNHPHAEQRLTPQEALDLFTINAAQAGLEESQVGDLKLGQLADFVVLDTNLLTCPPEHLKDIQVLMTVRGGELVYESQDVAMGDLVGRTTA